MCECVSVCVSVCLCVRASQEDGEKMAAQGHMVWPPFWSLHNVSAGSTAACHVQTHTHARGNLRHGNAECTVAKAFKNRAEF